MRVFLSYRRDDASGYAVGLYERLAERFGEDHVFMDLDTIRPGSDFASVIEEALETCDVLLSLVGRTWLTCTDKLGRRRLDDPDDFVRLELQGAHRRQIPVIPLLVQEVAMPATDDLPRTLAWFAGRQALGLSDRRWRADVRRLMDELERLETTAGRMPPPIETSTAGVLGGFYRVVDLIRPTIGPRRRFVIVDDAESGPSYTGDAVRIAASAKLEGSREKVGADLARQLVEGVRRSAGDGAGTTALLAGRLLAVLDQRIAAGTPPTALRIPVRRAMESADRRLSQLAREIETKQQVEQVVSVACRNATLGQIVAECVDKVGKDGAIVVEASRSFGDEIDLVEGMRFDRGYVAAEFVTTSEDPYGEVVLENPQLLLVDSKISAAGELVPVLDEVRTSGRSLVVIAHDIDDEALATLIVSAVNGTPACVAVKAPGFGERRRAMLQDIAVQTGAQVFAPDGRPGPAEATLEMLGQARRVIASRDETTIVEGAGAAEDIRRRIAKIKAELESTDSDYDREKLLERLAKLSGGVAVIKVGASSDSERQERIRSARTAIQIMFGAVEQGLVPGGGAALLRSGAPETPADETDDAVFAARAVARALEEPLRQIAINASVDADEVVRRVWEGRDEIGFDAEAGTYTDMFAAGIIDSARVLHHVVEAASATVDVVLSIT